MLTEKARNTNYFKIGTVGRPCRQGEICRKIRSGRRRSQSKMGINKAILSFIKKKKKISGYQGTKP